MAMKSKIPDKVQVRLTSSIETILASLPPYAKWIEEMLGALLSDTLTLELTVIPVISLLNGFCRGCP